MNPSQLQRYRSLLLEKQRELLSGQSDDLVRVPAAGGSKGDMVDQANADAEAELQIHLHKSDGRLLKAIGENRCLLTKSSQNLNFPAHSRYEPLFNFSPITPLQRFQTRGKTAPKLIYSAF